MTSLTQKLEEFVRPLVFVLGLKLNSLKRTLWMITNLAKLATRLMELGVLTPEQGMKVVHTGSFPDAKEMERCSRINLKKIRERGSLYAASKHN
jgi:hypothetical protein